jgi:ribose/xylose/arabinose/galactoside ABC-type transport system permease subunit
MAVTQDRKVVSGARASHGSQTAGKPNGSTTRIRRSLEGLEWRLTVLVAAMVVVTLFFGSLNRYYLSWAHFLDMGRQASLLVVAAIGANLIIVAGEIDLSVGAVAGLVSVAVPGFFDLGLPMPIVLLLALLIGAIVGAANGVITLRLMVPSFLTTLGTMAIVRGIALYISDQPRQVSDDAFAKAFNDSVAGLPEVLVYSFALTALAAFFWKYSRFGLQVRAVGSSQQGARFAGVPTFGVRFMVFILAGIFSAAGALLLLGRTLTGLAVAADGLELNAIAAVILGGGRLGGGKGSMVGTFLGAILLTMVFSGIAGMGLTAAWQLLTKGMILVVVILFMRK